MSYTKTGARAIVEEREEQVLKHGRTDLHDDQHTKKELAYAALDCLLSYVQGPAYRQNPMEGWGLGHKLNGDPIHLLKVAGALCAAEIDRLNRACARALEGGTK